jgi:hypothetical protein
MEGSMAIERTIMTSSNAQDLTDALRQPASPEELARRHRLVAETLEIRRRIGPVKLTLAELLDHRGEEVDD